MTCTREWSTYEPPAAPAPALDLTVTTTVYRRAVGGGRTVVLLNGAGEPLALVHAAHASDARREAERLLDAVRRLAAKYHPSGGLPFDRSRAQ